VGQTYDCAAVAHENIIISEYAVKDGSFDVALADILKRAIVMNPLFRIETMNKHILFLMMNPV
jgi:hypothetical protein